MNRRNKTQIYLDILLAIRRESGLKKTHIVYKANLTNTRVQSYLDSLLSKGFISEENRGNETFFIITDKGQNFLSQVNKLKEISEAFGLPII